MNACDFQPALRGPIGSTGPTGPCHKIKHIFKQAVYREKKFHKVVTSRLNLDSPFLLKIASVLFLLPSVLVKVIHNYLGLNAEDLVHLMDNLLSASWYSEDDNILTLVQNEDRNDYYVSIHSFYSMSAMWGGDVYATRRHLENKMQWLTQTAQNILSSKNPRLRISCFWSDFPVGLKILENKNKNEIYFENERNEFLIKTIYDQEGGFLIVNPLEIFNFQFDI